MWGPLMQGDIMQGDLIVTLHDGTVDHMGDGLQVVFIKEIHIVCVFADRRTHFKWVFKKETHIEMYL